MAPDNYTIKVLPVLIIAAVSLIWQQPLVAQVSQGGRHYSFFSTVTDSISARTLAGVDVAALLAEDELEAAQDSPVPPRFGYAFRVSLGMESRARRTPSVCWL